MNQAQRSALKGARNVSLTIGLAFAGSTVSSSAEACIAMVFRGAAPFTGVARGYPNYYGFDSAHQIGPPSIKLNILSFSGKGRIYDVGMSFKTAARACSAMAKDLKRNTGARGVVWSLNNCSVPGRFEKAWGYDTPKKQEAARRRFEQEIKQYCGKVHIIGNARYSDIPPHERRSFD